MDPFDLIAEDVVEQFGLFEKWRSERQYKKAGKAMARGDTDEAHEHLSKGRDLRQEYESKQDRGPSPTSRPPRRHMTRSEHEAMMDERDGRPRRPRRRRRRRPS